MPLGLVVVLGPLAQANQRATRITASIATTNAIFPAIYLYSLLGRHPAKHMREEHPSGDFGRPLHDRRADIH